jgi:hypothetical protein
MNNREIFEAYREEAKEAYTKYLEAQAEVSSIEAGAMRRATMMNPGAEFHQLKTLANIELGKWPPYASACGIRNMYMQVTQLNASMALLYKD